MGSRRAVRAAKPELTERQRYWLEHLEAAEREGEPLKSYAKRKRLSANSLYEAKRRLRALGVLAPAAKPVRRKPSASRFSAVTVSKSSVRTPPASLRARLSSGAVLEWDEAPTGEGLRELLEALS